LRLQKFLAAAGIASRRKCEDLIKKKLISLNGKVIDQVGIKININKDLVLYKNKRVEIQKKIYLILNKPVGYITSLKDNFNRPCVIDLIKISKRIFPVGRLDYNTSGLLILTNDGEFANKIMHPKNKIKKIYIAEINSVPSAKELKFISSGIYINNKKTHPAEIKIIKQDFNSCVLKIKIHEGMNRQIRKMFEAINYRVIKLTRIAIGKLKLDNLSVGKYKFLSEQEIMNLIFENKKYKTEILDGS